MSTKEMVESIICTLDEEQLKKALDYLQYLSYESEKQTAAFQLLNELAKGEQSASEQGWLSPEDVEQELGLL